MSLKGFHVLFIALSIVLFVMAGGWAWQNYALEGTTWLALFSMLSFAVAGLLIVYLVNFRRKARRIGL